MLGIKQDPLQEQQCSWHLRLVSSPTCSKIKEPGFLIPTLPEDPYAHCLVYSSLGASETLRGYIHSYISHTLLDQGWHDANILTDIEFWAKVSPRTLLCMSTHLVSLSKEKRKSYLQLKRDCLVRQDWLTLWPWYQVQLFLGNFLAVLTRSDCPYVWIWI